MPSNPSHSAPLVGQNTGITTRKPSRIEIWSRAVRDRDGKCLHCDSTEDLHAHHIQPKSTHPELKYELSNGITLCYRCHKQEHEKNRVRVRSNKPQRRTLYKQIAMLEAEVSGLKKDLSEKKSRIRSLEWEMTLYKNRRAGVFPDMASGSAITELIRSAT